jgi:hypothetical protein
MVLANTPKHANMKRIKKIAKTAQPTSPGAGSSSKSPVSGTLVRRTLLFRARALQDFAYALVKAEMDTDFEDECKEIVSRRQKATEKLKKIDKDHPELAPVSPSKMQVSGKLLAV